MAGLEIAGVVLGSIPLIVSAIEHYADAVQKTRRLFRYRRILEGYRDILETEYVIFSNTLELLFSGIANAPSIEKLLKDPGGDAWKEDRLEGDLKQCLGRSYDVFSKQVKNMSEALSKFRERLGLTHAGNLPIDDKRALKAAFKAGKIALSRGSYDDLISDIRNGNRALKELTGQSISLQSVRRGPRSMQKFQALRKSALSLYNAVEIALSCSCRENHRAGLDLDTSTSDPFRVMVSKALVTHSDVQDWMPLQLEIIEEEAGKSVPTPTLRDPKQGEIKSVTFAVATPGPSNFSTSQTGAISATSQSLTGSSDALRSINDLCASLQFLSTTSISAPLGMISDSKVTFCVRHCEYLSTVSSFRPVSLHQFFNGKSVGTASRLSQTDRLKLSITLSSAVLILNQTPWMPKQFCKQDILLLLNVPTVRTRAYITTQLLADRLQDPSSRAIPDQVPSFIENCELFTLGIILIEILFSMPIEQLRDSQNPDEQASASPWATQHAIATRLLREELILQEGGMRYESAVRSCIKCNFGPEIRRTDLADEVFCRAVYEHVTAQLEDFAKEFGRIN